MAAPPDRLIVPNTALTYEWLEEIMEKECGEKAEVAEVSSLGEVLGMMSSLRRVSLKWTADRTDLPKSVVIKVPEAICAMSAMEDVGASGIQEHEAIMKTLFHKTEAEVYNWFRTLSEKPIASPTIYASNSVDTTTPAIVMEDYKDEKLTDLTIGFTEDQLFEIVAELANFHALCFSRDDWRTLGWGKEGRVIQKSFNGMLHGICEKLKQETSMFSGCIDVFERNILKEDIFELSMLTYETGVKPAILAHGDLWAPQIMWDSKDKLVGILDWQVAHPGSVTEDISRVLATCTTTEMRRRMRTPLMDHYYSALSEKLRERGLEIPFGRDFLDEEYKENLPHTMAFTVFATVMWTNSHVLKKGDENDEYRIMETRKRTKAFLEDSIKLLEWE